MSFIIYRRPRAISIKDTKQAISFDRAYSKSISSQLPPPPLLAFESLPEWCQDNPHVRAGYRQINNSYRACFRSCTTIHNETFNILTHLIPAVALVASQYSVQKAITEFYPEATSTDRVVFGINVFAAIVTFTFSTLYHTLMCHSQHISGLWLRIDYMGILTLILGSFVSGIYVGFYCEPTPRVAHWTMITILSTITAILVVHSNFQDPHYRNLKAYAFIGTALTGFAPITHGLYLYGWEAMWLRSGMPFWLLEGIVYLAGACFFITRFPESAWPGYFDIYFNSHSIFHTLVVCASFVHMYGVWSAYDWNYTNARTCGVPF